jgi:hypothetical protein
MTCPWKVRLGMWKGMFSAEVLISPIRAAPNLISVDLSTHFCPVPFQSRTQGRLHFLSGFP